MPTTRTYHRSFAGGEVSPEMWGRIDDVRFQTGAATMRNFIALPQGPAENRPGFAFVREVKDSTKRTRLLPFTYSTTQTMVLELGAGYFRFHTQGATLGPGAPAAYNGATAYTVGDLVSSGGVNYYCIAATTGNAPPNATYWYPLPAGVYEIPNPYAEADLFDIHYVQSADVLTLVHPNYAPRELRRLGATTWTLTTISFGAALPAPGSVTATAERGESLNITAFTAANPGVATTIGTHGFTGGDPVYVNGGTWTGGTFSHGFYTVNAAPTGTTLSFKAYDSGVPLNTTALTAWNSGGFVQFGDKSLDFDNFYVVTAVASNNIDESQASSSANVINNLNAPGSSNTIAWAAVSGASRYNVYKRQNGLYGFIGQTSGLSFTDNNIAPNLGQTPPLFDPVFASGGNYPGAVSYFEQRRVFAGTTNNPQTLWMTRTSTESDVSYHIPVQDTDRILFRVAAREANTIRHLVPLTQLLALTSAAEWRISPVNSDTITPTTISVRPQSYVGANNVQPSIVNNTVVYCSARDGHVRELGYSWQASGFVTGDLSLRAAHLFDNYDLSDMCYSKSPQPLLWFISSTGRLLGLTYIPEQQVSAWHWHDTDGAFESCTAVAEGSEDRLYVVVRRTIGGVTKRYVERMASREVGDIEDCFFVDSGLSYDGTNTGSTTMTVTNDAASVTMTIANPCVVTWVGHTLVNGNSVTFTTTGFLPTGLLPGVTYYVVNAAVNTFQVALTAGGSPIVTTGTQSGLHSAATTYTPNNTLTLTASAGTFAAPDVGDAIVLTGTDGSKYRLAITAFTSTTVVSVRPDVLIPVALRNTPTASWGFARDTISGLGHLEGKTVSILGDGAVMPPKVVTSGTVSLQRASVIAHIGLPYQSDLQTLPMALQMEAFGQGRAKNVNEAFLRVYRSSGIFVGPDANSLVEAKQRTTEPYGSPPSLKTDEIGVKLTPSWRQSGQVFVRQSDPLPLTIVGLTLEAVIGG